MTEWPEAPALRVAFYARTRRTESGCLEWTGSTYARRGGYGCCVMKKFGIKAMRAHRVAWQIEHGPITRESHVLHRCDNPLCVNVDHLFIGNQAINMADKVAKGRHLIGDKSPLAKVSDTQAIAIKRDARSYKVIATEYGISKQTVCQIKSSRYSWKHLPNDFEIPRGDKPGRKTDARMAR